MEVQLGNGVHINGDVEIANPRGGPSVTRLLQVFPPTDNRACIRVRLYGPRLFPGYSVSLARARISGIRCIYRAGNFVPRQLVHDNTASDYLLRATKPFSLNQYSKPLPIRAPALRRPYGCVCCEALVDWNKIPTDELAKALYTPEVAPPVSGFPDGIHCLSTLRHAVALAL